MTRRDDLEIFVFSYDRGAQLTWCLDSLARHAAGLRVTVMDDRSTDPAVADALAGRDVTVWRPPARDGSRLGGLYPNMQAAFDRATARRAMFVQDDCQMVRPIEAAVFADLDAIFDDPAQMVATPAFPMGPRQRRRGAHFRSLAGAAAFHYVPPKGRGSVTARHFTAICVLDVAPMRAAGWRFGATEGDCARAFAEMGAAPMAHMARPVLCQLPEVPTARFGRRTLGARLAERLDGPEVRGFHDMTPAEVARLGGGARPPVAEDVLRPTHPGTTRPFIHKGVNRRGWTRALARLETMLRKR